MTRIDSRCPWVQVVNGTTVKVETVAYIDGETSRGNLGIYVFANLQKPKRAEWGIPYKLLLPGSWDAFATLSDFCIDMSGGLFYPDRGQRGPFSVAMGDALVSGMGLPYNQHVIYIITFQIITVGRVDLAAAHSVEQPNLKRAKRNRFQHGPVTRNAQPLGLKEATK